METQLPLGLVTVSLFSLLPSLWLSHLQPYDLPPDRKVRNKYLSQDLSEKSNLKHCQGAKCMCSSWLQEKALSQPILLSSCCSFPSLIARQDTPWQDLPSGKDSGLEFVCDFWKQGAGEISSISWRWGKQFSGLTSHPVPKGPLVQLAQEKLKGKGWGEVEVEVSCSSRLRDVLHLPGFCH